MLRSCQAAQIIWLVAFRELPILVANSCCLDGNLTPNLPPAALWAQETRLCEWQERVICTFQPLHACCTEAAKEEELVFKCWKGRRFDFYMDDIIYFRMKSLILKGWHMSSMFQTDLTLKIIDGYLAPSSGQKLCASGSLVGLWSLELSTATE